MRLLGVMFLFKLHYLCIYISLTSANDTNFSNDSTSQNYSNLDGSYLQALKNIRINATPNSQMITIPAELQLNDSSNRIFSPVVKIQTTKIPNHEDTNCWSDKDIGRVPPEVAVSKTEIIQLLMNKGGSFCTKIPKEEQYKTYCKFYECLHEEYVFKSLKYPHKRCLEKYPSGNTLGKVPEFYRNLFDTQQKFPNMDIKFYYGSVVVLKGSYYCFRKFNGCFKDKYSQYAYFFLIWKHKLKQHWYFQFHTNNAKKLHPGTGRAIADRLEMNPKYLNFIAIVATVVTFGFAVPLGVANVLVVRKVLSECNDAAARIFHYHETVLDLIQPFFSLITALGMDNFIVLLWAGLCDASFFQFNGTDEPHIGRLLAFGNLLPSQLVYMWLAKDRYEAMKYPLEYNSRGIENGKKAKRKVFFAICFGLLLALIEIAIYQFLVFNNTVRYYPAVSCQKYASVTTYELSHSTIQLVNFTMIATIVCRQFYYSISAFHSWYKYNKSLSNSGFEAFHNEASEELEKVKQRFVLLVGTCTMNFVCVTPWIMLSLVELSDWFCFIGKAFLCFDLTHLGLTFWKLCGTIHNKTWETQLRCTWPVFMILNCFSVIIHICAGKTYRNALSKLCGRLSLKNVAKVMVLKPNGDQNN